LRTRIPENSSKDPVSFAKIIIAQALKHIPGAIRVQTYNETGELPIVITEFAQNNNDAMIVIVW